MFRNIFLFCCLLQWVHGNLGQHRQNSRIENESYEKTSERMLHLGEIGDAELRSSSNLTTISNDVSWVTDIPNLPILFATSPALPNGQCRYQLRRYIRSLANSSLWAVQMFDASTKYPDGIIYGHTKHLGNFDQCYDLRVKLPRDDENSDQEDVLEGRHCLIRMKYRRRHQAAAAHRIPTLQFDPRTSAWDAIEDIGDFRRGKRDSIYVSLCVPAACSAADVEVALRGVLEELAHKKGLSITTTVNPRHCHSSRDPPKYFSTVEKIVCFTILTILVLVIASSWYDNRFYSAEEAANDHGSEKFLLTFSFRRNLHTILNPAPGHPGLDCIHLCRIVFTSWIIMCHRLLQYTGFPVLNLSHAEKLHVRTINTLLINGTIVNYGFLGIGGLVHAHSSLKNFDRDKKLNFINIVINRFLRLTPIHAMAIFLHSSILPKLGMGPFWEVMVGNDERYCADNWWTNFLYINNYVNPEKMCLWQSWYIAVDFQLHIMGSLVLWVFWKLPRRLGYLFLVSVLAVGLAIHSGITYAGNLHPMLLFAIYMSDPRRHSYFVNYYTKSHMLIAPYVVGILCGSIIYDHKFLSWKLSKGWTRLLFVFAVAGLAIGNSLLSRKYYDPVYKYKLHPIETALFASIYKAAFALGICCIPLLMTFGTGLELCYKFTTPRWIRSLAGLAYGTYLLHTLNQHYEIGSTRVPRFYSVYGTLQKIAVDIALAFGLSFIVSVLFDNPIRKLANRYVLGKVSPRKIATRISEDQTEKTD